jgi:hypothetical protein
MVISVGLGGGHTRLSVEVSGYVTSGFEEGRSLSTLDEEERVGAQHAYETRLHTGLLVMISSR